MAKEKSLGPIGRSKKSLIRRKKKAWLQTSAYQYSYLESIRESLRVRRNKSITQVLYTHTSLCSLKRHQNDFLSGQHGYHNIYVFNKFKELK